MPYSEHGHRAIGLDWKVHRFNAFKKIPVQPNYLLKYSAQDISDFKPACLPSSSPDSLGSLGSVKLSSCFPLKKHHREHMLGAAIDTPTPEILFWDDGVGDRTSSELQTSGCCVMRLTCAWCRILLKHQPNNILFLLLPVTCRAATFSLLLSNSGSFFPMNQTSYYWPYIFFPDTSHPLLQQCVPLCFPPLALLLTGVQPHLYLPNLHFPRGFGAWRGLGTAEHFQGKLNTYFAGSEHPPASSPWGQGCTSGAAGGLPLFWQHLSPSMPSRD